MPAEGRHRQERAPAEGRQGQERAPAEGRHPQEKAPADGRHRQEKAPADGRHRQEKAPADGRHRQEKAPADGRRAEHRVYVWDPVVRLFHWIVVVGVLLDYFVLEEGKTAHRYAGYVVAGALAVRLLWGFVGSRHARFADFLTTPRVALAHLAAVLRGRDRRYLGHNPAGAAMIVALMGLLAVTCLAGWMQGLDAFWGVEWVQELHEIAANLLVLLAAVHVVSALAESVVHRENLVLSMITGWKRAAAGTDVDHADSAGGG
jgi:cytochrome b